MKFILATKGVMTQKFAPDGQVIPVTTLLVDSCVVTQIKNQERDGYVAVQLATGTKRKLAKPLKGHFKALGSFRYVNEFRLKPAADIGQIKDLQVGDQIKVSVFQAGDLIQATGISKGHGFQGVVKRHKFSGHPASHGHKDQLRMPGSIGATEPQRVFKGKRMGGHMGDNQVTVKNLQVVEVDAQNNQLYVKGAIPGATGNLILISGPGELKFEIAQTSDKSLADQSAKDAPSVKPAPAESVVAAKPVSAERPVAIDSGSQNIDPAPAETKK